MTGKLNISSENTNAEVLARIVKASSHKYDCSMEIDFSNGNRVTKFVGDETVMSHIAEEVRNIFPRK